jgi:16S rRNA (guanine527-N7)-methyltransferase
MDKNLIEILKESSSAIHVPLTDTQVDLFKAYYREMVFWNEKINLFSPASPQDIIVKHFIDSLSPLPFMAFRDGRLLDIGSGGGFPGIPLKIAANTLQVFLLEASRKKTSFLKQVIRLLRLSRISVIHARVEQVMEDPSLQQSFDTVISRAALPLPILMKTGQFFLAPQGQLIVMKGPNFREDNDLYRQAGFVCTAGHRIDLPGNGGYRNIMIFQRDM